MRVICIDRHHYVRPPVHTCSEVPALANDGPSQQPLAADACIHPLARLRCPAQHHVHMLVKYPSKCLVIVRPHIALDKRSNAYWQLVRLLSQYSAT